MLNPVTSDPDHPHAPGGRSSDGSRSAEAAPDYTERLWPAPANWLIVPMAALAGALMVAPYGVAVWGTAAVVFTALAVAGFVLASPRIRVRDGVLYAAKAHIPVRLLGEIAWLDGEQARQERGPRLDARAYLMLRGWVRPVIRITIDDPADPTPYWLLSTRHPERLAAVLAAARG